MSDRYTACRYGDIVQTLFGTLDVVFDKSVADYQGEVCVLFKGDKYAYVQFYYGSCSGCDEWEDRKLTDAQIADEIMKLTMWFDSLAELEQYQKRGGQF